MWATFLRYETEKDCHHEPGEDGVEDGIEDGVEIVEDAGHHEQDVLESLESRGPTRNGKCGFQIESNISSQQKIWEMHYLTLKSTTFINR